VRALAEGLWRFQMTTALILFAVAALGGLVMALMRFGGRELPPMGLAIVHGLFAAAGLVALILALVGHGFSTATTIALVGFVGAALGGFYLFSMHMRKQALPIPYVVVHGLFAVASFVILLVGVYALR
jgi:glucose uptake protein GlcU